MPVVYHHTARPPQNTKNSGQPAPSEPKSTLKPTSAWSYLTPSHSHLKFPLTPRKPTQPCPTHTTCVRPAACQHVHHDSRHRLDACQQTAQPVVAGSTPKLQLPWMHLTACAPPLTTAPLSAHAASSHHSSAIPRCLQHAALTAPTRRRRRGRAARPRRRGCRRFRR